MSIPSSPARRALLRGGAALALAAWAPWLHAAPRRDITVLTAYPDAVVSRVEAAFERAFPHYRLRMVWRMPHDAGPYLLEPGQHGVDVYWSASPNTYARLKAAGALQALNVDFTGLPAQLGGSPRRDADGYYTASETAGYGFVLNPKRLAALNLAAPSDWPELAAPAYAEKADREKPINLEADRMSMDDINKVQVYEGNVILTQGTLQIRTAKLVVTQDADGFQKGVATGGENGLARFRQKREGKDEW
uniref:lipopolysaccharide transport periplasmic protein LptA n=1 Tax=Rivihabitans pingtungensis TaxID=1054498 RepID=UPI002FD8C14D